MKEQGKNTPDLTSEEEIGSLPEKEFIKMIVKMIQNLGNRIDKMLLSTDIENKLMVAKGERRWRDRLGVWD